MKYFFTFIFSYITILFSQNTNNLHYLNLDDTDDFSDLSILKEETNKYNFYFSGENHMFSNSNSKLEFKLLKYLHQKEGVKNLILEFGEGTGWLTNQYIHSANIEGIEEVMKQQFHEDYFEFFKKIKEYNSTLDSINKISITGIDLQRSYYIGIEALYLLLPTDTLLAHDSIQREVDLLRFLKGYVHELAKNNEVEDAETNYFSFYYKRYNLLSGLKTIEGNFFRYPDYYKNLLGDNYTHFDNIMNCLIKAKEFKQYEADKNPFSYMFREDYMFNKLLELIDRNPNEKFYGQFGRAHISTNRTSMEKYGTFNFNSLVSKIKQSTNPFLRDKVLSIGIYYINKQDITYLSIDHETDLAYHFRNMKNNEVAIEDVKDHPLLDSNIKANHQFIVIHNGSIREESPFAYGNDLFKSGFSIYYGAHTMNIGNLNTFFNSNFTTIPQHYIQLSLYAYGDQTTYVDYTFNIYSAKTSSPNDSIHLSLDGWNVFMNMGYDLTKNTIIDIIPYVGLGYQNMKINVKEDKFTSYNGLEGVEYSIKNDAFMLNTGLDVRIKLLPTITLTAKGGYLLDVSKDNWKYRNNFIDASNKFTGMYWNAGIAFGAN